MSTSRFSECLNLFLVGLLGVLLFVSPAPDSAEGKTEESPVQLISQEVEVDSQEKSCLARIIYMESRGESEYGQLMVGYATKNLAEGSTICQEMCRKFKKGAGMRRQYSSIRDCDNWKPSDHRAWRRALTTADHVLAGFEPPAHLAQASHYLNPTESDTVGLCWFKKQVRLDIVDKHHFYRPSTPQEKAELKKRLPPECT